MAVSQLFLLGTREAFTDFAVKPLYDKPVMVALSAAHKYITIMRNSSSGF